MFDFKFDRPVRELLNQGFMILQVHMLHSYPKQFMAMADRNQKTVQLVEVISYQYHGNFLENVTIKTSTGETITLDHDQLENDFYFKEVVG